ncbi:MAG: 23S rRNA (adenine(2503)-C(2))-methyltransferase RlmN [Alistipes sp.]|jgi:23S rRNA (adenine2503-C2)-methyltransferase|nr:23S rRNA (adenine(2503)-C(2))-methyltransferase RlmN [Alistipes sp.]MBO5972111.1 23S rRNA (adenine(2503)-C(2))-methyltransferase RlmN [Alistipes sp.]MBO7242992.1 23S rRNA (adenine(2503)-C(2))-methyltransferase RlmN [Alistipes sp.]
MTNNIKYHLFGTSLEELKNICETLGLPRFAHKQIAKWLYTRFVTDIDAMTDLSKAARQILKENCDLGLSAPLKVSESCDGTKKYLFRTLQGEYIESALIPDGERMTLCVSSQAGCKMGCKFCATGRMGFRHHLTSTEIINQIISIPERDKLTNLVFMGMGEPLDNIDNLMRTLDILTSEWGLAWSPTRITVSTAGVARTLPRLLDESKVHIAVSLHNPFPEERKEIMPIENSYSIREVCDILRKYDFTHQRRVSFEYIVLEGMNCSPRHIKELSRLLDGIKCRINLIRFHKIPDSPFFSPELERIIEFRDTLTKRGIQTTLRASRGEDIEAACGLLSTAEKK